MYAVQCPDTASCRKMIAGRVFDATQTDPAPKLIPLALRGVAYRPIGALAMLQRNLLIYGLGGVLVPFIGIKAIDLIITKLHLI